MDLPPLSTTAQIIVLVLFGCEHILAVLIYLNVFPPSISAITTNPLQSVKDIFHICFGQRKKQLDEETDSQNDYELDQRTVPVDQNVRPRWPFLDSRSGSSACTSTAYVTPTTSIRHRTPRTTKSRDTGPNMSSQRADKRGSAYTTSLSLSPMVTPTPLRRFLDADGSWSPSMIPISTVKTGRAMEMLSPSVYSPLPLNIRRRRVNGGDDTMNVVAGAQREGSTCNDHKSAIPSVESHTPVPRAAPVRPGRYFGVGREFETDTPESLEKESIVIGLGRGLSPLVGKDENERDRALEDTVAPGDNGGKVVSPAARTIHSETSRAGLELGRFATPLTEEVVDDVLHREPDVVRRFSLAHSLDWLVAATAILLANFLGDMDNPEPEDGLLLKAGDLSAFLVDL